MPSSLIKPATRAPRREGALWALYEARRGLRVSTRLASRRSFAWAPTFRLNLNRGWWWSLGPNQKLSSGRARLRIEREREEPGAPVRLASSFHSPAQALSFFRSFCNRCFGLMKRAIDGPSGKIGTLKAS
jgi:hypothetical protein